jgi:hypothetical protein
VVRDHRRLTAIRRAREVARQRVLLGLFRRDERPPHASGATSSSVSENVHW